VEPVARGLPAQASGDRAEEVVGDQQSRALHEAEQRLDSCQVCTWHGAEPASARAATQREPSEELNEARDSRRRRWRLDLLEGQASVHVDAIPADSITRALVVCLANARIRWCRVPVDRGG
jgi:hypothetical protein